jgi:hypothetical protein
VGSPATALPSPKNTTASASRRDGIGEQRGGLGHDGAPVVEEHDGVGERRGGLAHDGSPVAEERDGMGEPTGGLGHAKPGIADPTPGLAVATTGAADERAVARDDPLPAGDRSATTVGVAPFTDDGSLGEHEGLEFERVQRGRRLPRSSVPCQAPSPTIAPGATVRPP